MRFNLRVGVTQRAGDKYVSVQGQLDVLDGTTLIKTYQAEAALKMVDSEFSESLTQMRQRGLLAVRDNIEAQMYVDREFLKTLSTR